MAKRKCKYCGQQIGFDREFFDFGNFEFAHASCAYKESDKLSNAAAN